MRTSSLPDPRIRALLFLGGLIAFLAAQPAAGGPLIEYTGYTRPANVKLDKPKAIKGGVVPAAGGGGFDKHRAKEIAGTVYYMVYDRAKGTAVDTWGVGVKDFEKRFRVSRDCPLNRLDTEARYLYIYQVINDSGADGWVYKASVRLLIDPRLITSWGHFASRDKGGVTGVGFAMPFDEKGKGNVILPIGFTEARQGVAVKSYEPFSPHYRAPKPYSLATIQLFRGPLVGVRAGTEVGREPDKVVLVANDSFDDGRKDVESLLPRYRLPVETGDERRLAPTGPWRTWNWAMDARILGPGDSPLELPPYRRRSTRDRPEWPVVRAYWQDNPLTPGERGDVFGFTSNFPPVFDLTQIADRQLPLAAAAGVKGVAGVADGGPATPALAPAGTGGVPTPMTPAAAATPTPAPGAPAPAAGGLGGLGGGVGGAIPSLGGGGGFGSTGGGVAPFLAPGSGTGGGGALGGGTGSGSGTPTTNTGTTTNTQPPTNTNTNIVSVFQQQQEKQQQQQQQQQKQKQQQQQQQQQHQHQNNNAGHVVPAPPAWLLGLLGLPVFVFLARRRKLPLGNAAPTA